MTLRIDNFHGIQPRIHPSLLGAGMAVKAHNCRLKSGKLVPLRQPAKETSHTVRMCGGLEKLADTKSLHVWKHFGSDGNATFDFLAFKGVTWAAEGNIADDDYDRIFVTGETGVDFVPTSGSIVHDTPAVWLYKRSNNTLMEPHTLVKEPMAAPSAALATNESVDATKTSYYTYFFFSWFDQYGYESGLSDAAYNTGYTAGSNPPIEINDGTKVTFTNLVIPSGAAGVRVYMARNGSGGEDGYDLSSSGIQFLYEYTGSQSSFTISVSPASAAESEPGIESIPSDMRGMIYVAGGFYAGFSKSFPKTVMFSDVGGATSWPFAYRYDVKDNIVALATTSNSVFALTDGWPWVLSGTAPESMTATKLAGPAACVSPRGVCVYRNNVYFASHEGLMVISNDATAGTVCMNLTQKIFTKEQWQEYNPESCLLGQHDGALYLFFKTVDGERRGLVIDLMESADAVTTHDEFAQCVCVDNMSDTFYYVRTPKEEA